MPALEANSRSPQNPLSAIAKSAMALLHLKTLLSEPKCHLFHSSPFEALQFPFKSTRSSPLVDSTSLVFSFSFSFPFPFSFSIFPFKPISISIPNSIGVGIGSGRAVAKQSQWESNCICNGSRSVGFLSRRRRYVALNALASLLSVAFQRVFSHRERWKQHKGISGNSTDKLLLISVVLT